MIFPRKSLKNQIFGDALYVVMTPSAEREGFSKLRGAPHRQGLLGLFQPKLSHPRAVFLKVFSLNFGYMLGSNASDTP